MIEEEAYVAEVEDDAVWLVKNRATGCSACTESCPSSLSSRLFSAKQFRIRVSSNIPLHPGDKVLLGIEDDRLARASLVIYLLPLLSLFLGALLGQSLLGSDLASAMGGLAGLVFCLVGFKRLKPFERETYQPVVLRKII